MIAAELNIGIRTIELVVIASVRELGGKILEDSFDWNYGAANGTSPEMVFARITANGKIACLVLPREYCEDSATAVSRMEVWDAINNCVEFLAAGAQSSPDPIEMLAELSHRN